MKSLSILIVSLIVFLCSECRAESVGFYKAYLTLLACQTEESQPNVVECQCNGSGRSGDGLGPCVCGENCQCRNETVLDQAVQESEPLVRASQPELDLLYFSTTGCPPCDRISLEFDALKKTGWKIGANPEAHIIESNDWQKHQVKHYPCFILLSDGIEVKRHYGYMNRWQIAEFRKLTPVVQMQSMASPSPVRETMIAQDIEIQGLKTPFEKTVNLFKEMLGTTYKPNSFVTVTSPERVEISIEERDGKIYILFHGDSKPRISAVGVFESDVTHMIAEGNKITVYWNGVIGLLKNHLTVEFE